METEQSSDFIIKGKTADIEMLDLFGRTSIAYKTNIDGQTCFIKKLRPELRNDKRCRDLFYKEYNTGKRICSPYVVKYLDIRDNADGLCIIMEYVSGCTIKEKIEREPEYFKRKENIRKLLLQLCEALDTLHKENVVYLDINPGNIMISQTSNNIKLIDLGFCLSDWNNTTAGTTAGFGAPEATKNNTDEIDARSDIYSIGCLLQYIEEKTGTRLPWNIRRIAKRCLQKEKALRYSNTYGIIRELKHCRNIGWKVAIAAILFLAPFATTLYEAIENRITWENGRAAHKFEENGIFYRITDHDTRTVEVTYKGDRADEYYSEYGDGKITIPATVTYLGREFRVTSIATGAFDNPETTSVTLPEGLERIDDKAFYDCRLSGIVYIPKSVTHIGELVFEGNTCIESFVVDGKNPKYDSRYGCNAIIETGTNTLVAACANTVIPENVTAIGDNAFLLYQRPTIAIPQGTRSIGNYSFCNSAIKEIALPDSLTSIGGYAFEQCKMLQAVALPEKLEVIGTGAFSASGLQEIIIPHCVETVKEKAFAHCINLQSAIIGRSVKELGAYAFENCERLTKVISHIPADELTPTGSGCFNGIAKECVLYVPKGTKRAYERTYGWNGFAKIVEM